MGIVIALVVLLAGGIYILTNDDGKDSTAGKDSTDTTVQAAGEIFLEPISDVGSDPFTDDFDTNTAPAPPGALGSTTTSSSTSSSSSSTSAPATALRGFTGTAPGLYGGSGNLSSCDVPKLIDFLEQNPDKGRAWAEVLGIDPATIRDYVMTLTPVVLRADTRVTNHGYRDGRATTLQSILQAGTAVLVDSYGVPRVKCNCGNPLLPPTPVSAPPVYTGPQWPTFNPVTVVVVQPAPTPAPTIILIDLNHGAPIERPPGVNSSGTPNDTPVLIDTFCDLYPRRCVPNAIAPPATTTTTRPGEEQLGTGELQATLRWYSTADLDLSVTDPGGETISYNSPSSSTGGTLDVDANSGCSNTTSVPAENIFWPSRSAPVGDYTITVTYYEECAGGEGPQPFDVTVLSEGGEVAIVPATTRRATTAHTPTATPLTLTYTFRVEGRANRLLAHNTGTLSSPGDSQTFLAAKEGPPRLNAPPGAPTDFRAAARNNGATLAWKPPASSGGGSVQRYIITIQPGGTEIVTYAPATTIDIPGLRAGTSYTFTVTAENVKGKGPTSQPSQPITPRNNTPTPTTTPTTGESDRGTSDATFGPGQGTGARVPPAPTAGAPGPATGLVLDNWYQIGEGSALGGALWWELPIDDGGSPITGWLVEAEQLIGTDWLSTGWMELSSPQQGLALNPWDGANPPNKFRIRISAVNALGEGAPSEWLDFSIGCDVYGNGIGPQYMVRTLCEHDPLADVSPPGQVALPAS